MIDQDQLSDLFSAHAARLLLYARQWLNRAAAEDVVQDAFIQLLQQRRLPDNAVAWLHRAVRNQSINHFRSHQRRRKREASASANEVWFQPSTQTWLDGQAAKLAMEQLPAEQREVLVLRIWGQRKLGEIAAITGSKTSTVFDQYRAALTALRKAMGVQCQYDRH